MRTQQSQRSEWFRILNSPDVIRRVFLQEKPEGAILPSISSGAMKRVGRLALACIVTYIASKVGEDQFHLP